MTRKQVANRRKRVLRLYDSGLSQIEIEAKLRLPPATVALDLKMSPGYEPRPTLATSRPAPGRITAAEAAKRHGIGKLQTLCEAIDADVVRGEAVHHGRRTSRTVDPDEFARDIANLPVCLYEGCDRPALAASGACSGPHARAKVAGALEGVGSTRKLLRQAGMRLDLRRFAGYWSTWQAARVEVTQQKNIEKRRASARRTRRREDRRVDQRRTVKTASLAGLSAAGNGQSSSLRR